MRVKWFDVGFPHIDSSAVEGLALWNLLSRQAVSLYGVRSTAANLLAIVYRSVLLIRIRTKCQNYSKISRN